MAKWGSKAKKKPNEAEEAAVSAGIKNTLDTKIVAKDDKAPGVVGRSWLRTKQKIRNDRTFRIICMVLVLLVGIGIAFAVSSMRTPKPTISKGEYQSYLTTANVKINEGNFEAAEQALRRIQDSNLGQDDMFFFVAKADLANYTKDTEQAKIQAQKALTLYKPKDMKDGVDTDSLASTVERMMNYAEGVVILHKNEFKSDYNVPEEQSKDPEFQG